VVRDKAIEKCGQGGMPLSGLRPRQVFGASQKVLASLLIQFREEVPGRDAEEDFASNNGG
jgi:hypothetical protein